MRAIILILILAVVALIVAILSGFLDIRQIRGAEAPRISASGNGVTATGGQTPVFEVETGKVAIGSEDRDVSVKVPTVAVERPADNAQAATANSAN